MERVYPSNIAREREDSKQTCEKKLWEKNNYNEVFFLFNNENYVASETIYNLFVQT
jgi:hypothetical protein